MDDQQRRAAVEAIANAMTTAQRPQQPGFLPLPEIPQMHAGKLFNLDGRQWRDGREQSLDFYLQPSMSPKGIGLNGFGLLYRKTY